MNPLLRAAAATVFLIVLLVALLGTLAGATLFLGWVEGVPEPYASIAEWSAGIVLAAGVVWLLVKVWWEVYDSALLAPRALPVRETDTISSLRRELFARVPNPLPPDGYYDEIENIFITGVGQQITRLHPASACEGRGCSIHHPSDHNMRHMKTLWRDDRGIMERVCEHGTGHPDPDQRAFWQELVEAGRMRPEDAAAEAVHGCDGCCVPGGAEVLQDKSLPLDERQERFRQLSQDAASGQVQDT